MILRGMGSCDQPDGCADPTPPPLPEPTHPAMESAAIWIGVMVVGLLVADYKLRRLL